MLLNSRLMSSTAIPDQVSDPRKKKKKYQSSQRRFQNGRRAAVVRALTAAKLHTDGATLQGAAEACGSNVRYVAAATVVLKSENSTLLEDVLWGDTPLLVAAERVRHLAALVGSFRDATAEELVNFGSTVGPDFLFDNVIVPAVNVPAA